jgi:hypothetical protein
MHAGMFNVKPWRIVIEDQVPPITRFLRRAISSESQLSFKKQASGSST